MKKENPGIIGTHNRENNELEHFLDYEKFIRDSIQDLVKKGWDVKEAVKEVVHMVFQ